MQPIHYQAKGIYVTSDQSIWIQLKAFLINVIVEDE